MRALETIRSEHRNLAQVLSHLRAAAEHLVDAPQIRRESELITSVIYYVRVFPDRLHHPKEEDHLFAALRRRAPDAGPLLDALCREHAQGKTMLDALDAALARAEGDGAAAAAQLREGISAYVTFELAHMRREEEEVLPLAERVLTPEDWRAIDSAFARNADPVFGADIALGFETLRRRILEHLASAS